MTLHSALLLGSDHIELEQIAIEELTPNIAIGISRGRFPKGYPHLDPNEDAVFAATDGTTTILVVADGHSGFEAAHAAVAAIERATPQALDQEPVAAVASLTEAAIRAVATEVPQLPAPRDESATSITIAAITEENMAVTTIGDTAAFTTTRRRATRIGLDTGFLSPSTDQGSIRIEASSAGSNSVIVLTSDGFLDFAPTPNDVLQSLQAMPSKKAVNMLVRAAFAGGAGDNIAVAVHRPT